MMQEASSLLRTAGATPPTDEGTPNTHVDSPTAVDKSAMRGRVSRTSPCNARGQPGSAKEPLAVKERRRSTSICASVVRTGEKPCPKGPQTSPSVTTFHVARRFAKSAWSPPRSKPRSSDGVGPTAVTVPLVDSPKASRKQKAHKHNLFDIFRKSVFSFSSMIQPSVHIDG